jgi:hypothetical protein
MQHGIGWLVQRHTLRQRGIALTGPAAQTLIDPVSPGDLQQAMGPILHEWAAELLADPTLVNSRGYQSYIVLSLCRILYTRQHGAIISKPAAVQWAQQNLPERWRPLIERAWLGRQQPDLKAQPPDVSETLDFIRYALEYGRDA